MANSAFDDLNIDFSDMMTDPSAFSKRVMEAAENLKDILKADTSVNAFKRETEEQNVKADRVIHVLANGLYDYADELPLEQMADIIAIAEKLVKDLKTQYEDRVVRHLADKSDSMYNKKIASLQYAALRNAYNDYTKFVNSFMKSKLADGQLELIPALPGNWGKTTGLKHYLFEYQGEAYYHHNAVCRKVGLPDMYYHDAKEYFNEHPELGVTVKEVL